VSLFAKIPPEKNEIRKEIFNSFAELHPFQREFFFYHSMMDLFKDVIEDNHEDVRDILDFLPKSYTLPGPFTFDRGLEAPLIFEDLSKNGYRMWKDEFNGLDIPHAAVVLEAYGKLHALGMVLLEKGDVKDEIITKLFNLNPAFMIIEIKDKALKTFQDWMMKNKFDTDALAKLEHEMKDRNYLKTADRLYEEGKTHELQVIKHHDARSNNIMFKYRADNKTPEKANLVDFQFSSFSTPYWDLVYFLALSVSSDNLIPNYQYLIDRFFF